MCLQRAGDIDRYGDRDKEREIGRKREVEVEIKIEMNHSLVRCPRSQQQLGLS